MGVNLGPGILFSVNGDNTGANIRPEDIVSEKLVAADGPNGTKVLIFSIEIRNAEFIQSNVLEPEDIEGKCFLPFTGNAKEIKIAGVTNKFTQESSERPVVTSLAFLVGGGKIGGAGK